MLKELSVMWEFKLGLLAFPLLSSLLGDLGVYTNENVLDAYTSKIF